MESRARRTLGLLSRRSSRASVSGWGEEVEKSGGREVAERSWKVREGGAVEM